MKVLFIGSVSIRTAIVSVSVPPSRCRLSVSLKIPSRLCRDCIFRHRLRSLFVSTDPQCVLSFYFLRTPSRAPYKTPPACAKRATYSDPPPVVIQNPLLPRRPIPLVLATLLSFSPPSSPSRHPPFTLYPSPSCSIVSDGPTSPHVPRLVVPPRTQLYNRSCSNKHTHGPTSVQQHGYWGNKT